MIDPKVAAAQALDKVVSDKEHIKSNNAVDMWLGMFIEAVRAKRPEMQFTARDIKLWAVEYAVLTGETPPDSITNPYSLGRLLATTASEYGIVTLGTYANRQIFTLEANHEKAS